MVLGPYVIQLLDLVARAGLLRPRFSVLDLGDCVFTSESEAGADCVDSFVGEISPPTSAAELYARMKAARYECAGRDHSCSSSIIDEDFSAFAGSGFDLVTNFGTTACLFDQALAFKTIHTSAAPTGLMIHLLPQSAGGQSGVVLGFAPAFFTDLAAANGYEVLGLFHCRQGRLHDVADHHDEPSHDAFILSAAILRRTGDAPFRLPRFANRADFASITQERSAIAPTYALNRLMSQGKHGSPHNSTINRRLRGGWDGCGDPFAFHTEAAICSLAEGVAAIYGFDVPGDIAEFGTMSGNTAVGLARAIRACDVSLGYAANAYGHPNRRLVLLDSFEGLPEMALNTVDNRSPHVRAGIWGAGSLRGAAPDELHSMVSEYLPADRIEILPGWFSDTVPSIPADRRFALLHIDCDLYQSAVDVLDSMLSREMVARGAYIYFDDWNCNSADPDLGERRAWREMVAKYQILFSDEGTYAIFARRFVIHDYTTLGLDKGS